MRPEPSPRLRRLASRYALSGDQQQQLLRLLEVLERGGRAPTAVRDPDGAIDQHLADSLVALERESQAAAEELGLRRADVRSVMPFAGARSRYLHLYSKVSETPSRFPRRAGVARRRPLGG